MENDRKTLDEFAALLQLFAHDKVVVHVEWQLPPREYGQCRAQAWHTVYVDQSMSMDDRITLQSQTAELAMADCQARVQAAHLAYLEQQLVIAKKEKELQEAQRDAYQAKLEAGRLAKEAAKEEASNKRKAREASARVAQEVATLPGAKPKRRVVTPRPDSSDDIPF